MVWKIILIVIACTILLFLIFAVFILWNYRVRPEKPLSEKRRIACIGDSITFGAGVLMHRKEQVWCTLLCNELGDSYQVMNFGISGATLQSEGRQPYRRDIYAKAMEAKPEQVILMLGTNDSKPYNWNADRYEEELSEWIDDILSWDGMKQLWVMIPPFSCAVKGKEKIAFDIRQSVVEQEISPIIKKIAEEKDVQIIDLQEPTRDHPEYYSDGVHPNQLGNGVIAEVVYRAITAQIEERSLE